MQRRLDEKGRWKARSLINGTLWRSDCDTAAAEGVIAMIMRRESYTKETSSLWVPNATQQPHFHHRNLSARFFPRLSRRGPSSLDF
jgi:hypothetical protein